MVAVTPSVRQSSGLGHPRLSLVSTVERLFKKMTFSALYSMSPAIIFPFILVWLMMMRTSIGERGAEYHGYQGYDWGRRIHNHRMFIS